MSVKCPKCGYIRYGPNPDCPVCSGQIKPPHDLVPPVKKRKSVALPEQRLVDAGLISAAPETEDIPISPPNASLEEPKSPEINDTEISSNQSKIWNHKAFYFIAVIVVFLVVVMVMRAVMPSGNAFTNQNNDKYVGQWREQIPIAGDMEDVVDSKNILVITKNGLHYSIIRYDNARSQTLQWNGVLSKKGLLYGAGERAESDSVEITVDNNRTLKMKIDKFDGSSTTIPFRAMIHAK